MCLKWEGPPQTSMQSIGGLGISSKTPAVFPEDFIHMSNFLQTLIILPFLSPFESIFVCPHFSGVIKLPKLGTNCSQVQILQDERIFFSAFLLSSLTVTLHILCVFTFQPNAGSIPLCVHSFIGKEQIWGSEMYLCLIYKVYWLCEPAGSISLKKSKFLWLNARVKEVFLSSSLSFWQ